MTAPLKAARRLLTLMIATCAAITLAGCSPDPDRQACKELFATTAEFSAILSGSNTAKDRESLQLYVRESEDYGYRLWRIEATEELSVHIKDASDAMLANAIHLNSLLAGSTPYDPSAYSRYDIAMKKAAAYCAPRLGN